MFVSMWFVIKLWFWPFQTYVTHKRYAMAAIRNMMFKVKVKVDKQRSCFVWWILRLFHIKQFATAVYFSMLLLSLISSVIVIIHSVVVKHQWNLISQKPEIQIEIFRSVSKRCYCYCCYEFAIKSKSPNNHFIFYKLHHFRGFSGTFVLSTHEKPNQFCPTDNEIFQRYFFFFLPPSSHSHNASIYEMNSNRLLRSYSQNFAGITSRIEIEIFKKRMRPKMKRKKFLYGLARPPIA